MMTVKHITLSGEEFLYPTSEVNFTPAVPSLGDVDPAPTVWVYGADDRARPLTGGTVYVMNDHGKTVCRYELSTQSPDGLGRQMQPQRPA